MDRHAYPASLPQASINEGSLHHGVAEGRITPGGLALHLPVSVVVPTCGRAGLLNRCLATLTTQTLRGAGMEIIVVDDAPSDATRDVVGQWTTQAAQRGLQVRYVANHGPHCPAAARNRGWRHARSAVIAFTDDGAVPDADWLRHGQMALDGFDEQFRLAWREDSDFHIRLLAQGARIRHAPDALVVHPVRPAKWGVSISQQKKIQFDALLYKKPPLLYREKIRATPRWDYCLTVASLLAALLGAATGNWTLAALAAAAWLAMTAWLCAIRLRNTSRTAAHVLEMALTSAAIPVLQLGRMVPRKGVDTTIEAIAALRDRHGVTARLMVVGSDCQDHGHGGPGGPEMARLKALAEQRDMSGQVYFAGQRPRSELRDYYSAADVFVTTPWHEPFGVTPLEAMACSVPVIGSAVGGIKHTVVDGRTPGAWAGTACAGCTAAIRGAMSPPALPMSMKRSSGPRQPACRSRSWPAAGPTIWSSNGPIESIVRHKERRIH
ncbi:glycosyltransferase [Noviherbaspirillum soli]|uniref:glycosyltransferase n=1 Tax=Noviherbaspirillum soli TaxID=1064518 RepID=UPI001E33CA68|nr:glycosyltransferase [Noviherbaspirillum soli]